MADVSQSSLSGGCFSEQLEWRMFLRAACRFRELKAFVASTRMMASVSEDSNTCRIAWTADSQPDW